MWLCWCRITAAQAADGPGPPEELTGAALAEAEPITDLFGLSQPPTPKPQTRKARQGSGGMACQLPRLSCMMGPSCARLAARRRRRFLTALSCPPSTPRRSLRSYVVCVCVCVCACMCVCVCVCVCVGRRERGTAGAVQELAAPVRGPGGDSETGVTCPSRACLARALVSACLDERVA